MKNNVVQENESIARAFIEAWDSHDVNKLNSLFAEKFTYTQVARGQIYSTREALSNYGNLTIAGIPDTKFEIVSVMANEKLAAIEWIWKGTNSVGWDFMGIPATGKYFELPGVSVMEIENHKIKRNNDYWDWNTFMRLIGANQQYRISNKEPVISKLQQVLHLFIIYPFLLVPLKQLHKLVLVSYFCHKAMDNLFFMAPDNKKYATCFDEEILEKMDAFLEKFGL